MSEEIDFYTHPMSRGQTVRWMLEETGVPYRQHLLDYGTSMKAPDYLAINPMGKVPAIVHKGQTVTECAAICAYLAEAFPDAGLLPDMAARGTFFRWIFFVAGPMEAAFGDRAAGWEPDAEKQRMFGYGHYDLAVDTLETAVAGRPFVAGDRFSAADVYVGSFIDFMLTFNMLPARPAFEAYVGGLRQRPAYVRAKSIDNALIAGMQAATAS